MLGHELEDQSLEGIVLRDLANTQAVLKQSTETDANLHTTTLTPPNEASCTRWAYGQFLIRQRERKQGIALLAECVAHEQQIGHAKADEHAALVEYLRAGGELPT
jgi:hypothetical protein